MKKPIKNKRFSIKEFWKNEFFTLFEKNKKLQLLGVFADEKLFGGMFCV